MDTASMSPWNGIENKRLRFLLVGCLISALIVGVAVRYNATQKLVSFRFPTQVLAALDHDLQARFAVVPDKDFGIERTYGNQHYLYNPQSPRELATIRALKKNNTEAAFYLMSRALWLRSWDGAGYKPIQGPVHLTGKITLPLPRLVNFMPKNNNAKGAIIDQEHSLGAEASRGDLYTQNPDGTPVSSPTPPYGVPRVNNLQELGNRVFEMAEEAPHSAQIGIDQKMNDRWKVVAVPIRASKPECVSCHTYHPMGRNPNATSRLSVEVGDALGVAFYLYSVAEKQEQQKQAITNKAHPVETQ